MPVLRKRRILQYLVFLSFVFALLSNSKLALCQEALKMSTASDQAAAWETTTSGPDYYNLGIGPVKLRFQGEMAIAYNNNVEYSAGNPQADISLSPGVNLSAVWPVTEQNRLELTTGIGYVYYLKTSSLNHPYITPNSALTFKMYTGDFVINFHDRFSVTEDVAQSPTVSGTGEFGQLDNTIGVGVDWNLYKLILSFGYDHDMVLATTSNFEDTDHNSELFTLRAALRMHETAKLGLELTGGITTYDQTVLSDNTDYSIGPFYEARLSEHISVNLSGGYSSYMFSPNGASNALVNIPSVASNAVVNTPNGLNNNGGYYANLSLTHQVNSWLNQSLTASRQTQLGITANLTELYSVSYQANWGFIRNINLKTQLLYEHGTTFGGALQTLDVYGGDIGLSYNITKKLTGSVDYDLQVKKAAPASLNYIQNLLVFDFKYSF